MLTPHAVAVPQSVPARTVIPPAWPSAGSALVDLTMPGTVVDRPEAAGVSASATGVHQAGNLPLTLAESAAPQAATSPGGSISHVVVNVQSHSAAQQVGVDGVMFTLAAPDKDAGSGPVTASLSYKSFKDAFGANWSQRLRLVQLPACALTSPQLAVCRVQTSIPDSRNDYVTSTVSATVTVPAVSTKVSAAVKVNRAYASSGDLNGVTASPSIVLAAVSGASGTNGDFTAAPIGPSGTWSVTGSTGSFTWSYPLAVPKPATGTPLSLGLSYDSSVVDGRTATTNNQSGWVGQGWSLDTGAITRSYRSCADDTSLPTAEQTGDMCWSGQVVMMNLGGKSTALVLDDSTKTWHAAGDDGYRVELLTGASNGVNNGEYWRVTDTSGIQYYFGRNHGPGYTNQGNTNSAWTVPVYGAHSGDPCYSSSGFSASSCLQAWQWNLDYVEDTHGNVQMYYYTPETNYYGADNGTTGVSYDRGGYLSKIDYGVRDVNGSVYGSTTPNQVVFTVSERCLPSGAITCDPSQMTAADASYWPDTPVDQQCLDGATCANHSPTFWSTKRLTDVTTQYWNGSTYTKVDSYDLAHQFPDSGDPDLWLASITRTGYAADGSKITMPSVYTKGQTFDNRVAGYLSRPPMSHWRLTGLITDTGSVIDVTYTPTQCSAANVPSDPSTNTMRCFPAYWVWPGDQNPSLDWFHKYLVSQINVQDSSGYAPQQISTYTYVGGAAWHYDDNELVKPANRTYGQYRGYGEVDVSTGDPTTSDPLTLTKNIYYRGMDGDTLPGGKTRSATVTDSLGEVVADNDVFAGATRESQVVTGVGGTLDHTSITDLGVVATTASRARSGLSALTATMVRTVETRSRQAAPAASGGWIPVDGHHRL